MNGRVLVVLALTVVPIFAQPKPAAVPAGLETANIFALGPVGYAGTIPPELIEFEAIMSLQPEYAKRELERLYSSGNPQAMSYALVGMRMLDRKRYSEMLSGSRASNLMVVTMWGCELSEEELRSVANELDSGKYDRWLSSKHKIARQ